MIRTGSSNARQFCSLYRHRSLIIWWRYKSYRAVRPSRTTKIISRISPNCRILFIPRLSVACPHIPTLAYELIIVDYSTSYKSSSIHCTVIVSNSFERDSTMAKLHGFSRNSEFITDFDGEFEEQDIIVSKRPRYLRQISTAESPSNPIDPHRVETMDKWVETHDVVVTISTTKKAYDNYRWNEERILRLESTIARFVKGLKGDTLTAVAGKYSMNAEQIDVFDSLNMEILDEARNLKMHAYENFASFLARKFVKINDALEKFEQYLENWFLWFLVLWFRRYI